MFLRRLFARRPARPARKPGVRLAFTALEDRTVPTVVNSFSGGILTITSDADSDVIKVYRDGNSGSDYYYVANGVPSDTFSGVTGIVVNGGDGNDVIDASGVATPVPYDWRKTQPTASSWYSRYNDPVYAFNGAGLSADGSHTATGPDGYFSNSGRMSTDQADVDGQYLQEYLGDAVKVSKLVIWNYNQSYNGQSYANRGVQTADILTSMDGVNWTTRVAGVTLTEAPASDDYNTPDAVYLPGAPTAKYVRILAHSNWGNNTPDDFGNFVGLSEVKVYGDAATPTVMGAALSPAKTTASSTYSGYNAVNATNGFGLTPINPAFEDTDWRYTWMSANKANVSGQYLQVDLGVVTQLDRIRVWNYNQVYGGQSYGNRGMKNVQVQFSTNGVTFTTVATPVFPQAPGTTTYTGFDVDLSSLPATRYVRLVALSNYGSDSYGNFVGLSDVLYFAKVAAPVPAVPVTIDGGIGNDTITGGSGPDTLTGGTGNDVFGVVPNSTTTQDTITDFVKGADLLDLRAFGVGSRTALEAQGGSVSYNGTDGFVFLPPAWGSKSLKLSGFDATTLGDTDFVM